MAVVTPTLVKPHHVRARCGHLIHRDGTTDGPRINPSAAHERGYSIGICGECFAQIVGDRR